jgi:hypothetical protein
MERTIRRDAHERDAHETASGRATSCRRCGGTRLLITDDGPVVCRNCVYAWTSFARIAAPTVHLIPEPGRAELEHRARHRALASIGCAYCAARR